VGQAYPAFANRTLNPSGKWQAERWCHRYFWRWPCTWSRLAWRL